MSLFWPTARQEEEDQTGNQNSWKPAWRNQHHPSGGHSQRPGGESESRRHWAACQHASCGNPVLRVAVCVYVSVWCVCVSVCVCVCVCVHAVIMIATYLLFSSVKPCVVLSLQSRTPALVFECINNTDFKVLEFGRLHTCWTSSTVTIHAKALISIINNTLNPPVNVVHVARDLLTSRGQGLFFFNTDVFMCFHRSFTRSWQTMISVTTCMSCSR